MSKKYIQATDDMITRAMVLLKINNFNLGKTAREMMTSRQNIRNWAKKSGYDIERLKRNDTSVFPANTVDKRDLAVRISILKRNIIDQLSYCVPLCKSVDQLSRALQIVDGVEHASDDKDLPAGTLNHTQNFIQVINQAIQKQNEQNS